MMSSIRSAGRSAVQRRYSRRGDPHVRVGELRAGQPLLVLAAGGDQRVDQRVAGLGVVVELEPGDRAGRAEVVARVAHPAQQADRRHRGVEADGVADAGCFETGNAATGCVLLRYSSALSSTSVSVGQY